MAGRLLFNDEFNNFDPHNKSDAWRTAFHWGPDQVLHQEKGYYVDTENAGAGGAARDVNPFSVSGGVLTITSAPASGLPNGQSYTTGVLSSQDSFQNQYGYYEVRAKLPEGHGFFPAFWLLPADKGTLPELDVMEYSSRFPDEYVATLHSTTGGGSPVAQEFAKNLPDLTDDFHTYGVEWKDDEVVWYFDNKEVHSMGTPADLHEPMYLLLNQAVGGGPWIGNPDGSTQRFEIDHVRVYDGKPPAAGAAADEAAAPWPSRSPDEWFAPSSS